MMVKRDKTGTNIILDKLEQPNCDLSGMMIMIVSGRHYPQRSSYFRFSEICLQFIQMICDVKMVELINFIRGK